MIAACIAALAFGACGSDEPDDRGDAPAGATSTPTPDRPALSY
jgi:hypothetical protein